MTVGINTIKDMDFIKYDSMDGPFKDKDARFQAFVIYPGIKFRNTDIIIQGGIWKSNGELSIYDDSNPSETVGGTTYYGYGAINETYYSGFYYRGHTNDGSWYTTGFGIRKFLNPDKAVSESQNPWYDIRYTEILLNYCEAQVEVGGANAGKSKDYLNQIRKRAFFQDQRDATLDNVLHERRVELCFEEDYARTLYRRRAFFQDQRDATLDNILKERRVELAFENDYARTLFRRRAFFNRDRDLASNPNGGRKHALIPVLDLQSGSPKYIFVRANSFDWDTDKRATIASWNPLSYYSGIPNYNTTNKLTPNPSQE